MRDPAHGERGVTLIELLIALSVGAIVLVAIFAVVQSQQTAYYQGHLQRAAQGSARSALEYLEQRLSIAGYGMDAPLAFDFDRYPALPCPAEAAPCTRDRTDGNDELVFYARNPTYWVPANPGAEPAGNAWRILSVDDGSVSVMGRVGDSWAAGRILQAVCKGATRYAYFTVRANVPRLTAAGETLIPLAGVDRADPFKRQDQAMAAVDGCFVGSEARLFLIDRYRFHVRPVPTSTGFDPYLVLDTGLDANGDGPDPAEEIVVAEGIESFQVGYVMTEAALAPRAVDPGTPLTLARGPGGSGNGISTLEFPGTVDPGVSVYRPTSWYGYALGPPVPEQRKTDHQANIRAVRIAILARGPQPEPAAARTSILLPVMNQNVLPAWIDPNVPYARARVETTVLLRNMVDRGMNDF